MARLKQGEVLARFGMSRESLRKWEAAGLPRLASGQYEEDAVRAWLRVNGKIRGEEKAEDGERVLPELPPAVVDGRANPEHYRARLAEANREARTAMLEGGRLPFNYESFVNGVLKEAKLAGLNEDDLMDQRSDADKIKDAIAMLLSEDAVERVTVDDESLRLVMQRIVEAIGLSKKVLDEWTAAPEIGDGDVDALREHGKPVPALGMVGGDDRAAELGKYWLCRMRLMLRSRKMARERDAVPPPKMAMREEYDKWRHAVRGSYVLRFMAYCERSDMPPPRGSGPEWSILRFGLLHAKMAVHVYLAENGLEPMGRRIVKLSAPFKGAGIVSPPGHGKSLFLCGKNAEWLIENARTQAVYLHAAEGESVKNVDKIAAYFKLDNATGRRCRTLFPHLRVKKNKNASGVLHLAIDHKLKDPNLVARGVMGKALGSNTSKQTWDDVVPQTDANQPSERTNRHAILTGTWLSRQRGTNAFLLIAANMWHMDDAVARLRKDQEKNQIPFLVLKVGGPDTNPPFEALWPEVYPSSELAVRYRTMRNNALWSAAYMANPLAESMRIVKKLRLYDVDGEDHAEFVRTCGYHLSIDPSAVNREKADKTGLVCAGLGELKAIVERDGAQVTTYRRVLRIVNAREFHANQVEIVNEVQAIAKGQRVDRVYVETKTGFAATADMLEELAGADAVVRLDPINLSKAIRLRSAAPFICEAASEQSGNYACVEFPGKRQPDGTLRLCEDMEEMSTQVLEFGIAQGDHMVDALSQLVNRLALEGAIACGESGTFSQLVRRSEQLGDPRMRKYLAKALEKANNREPAEIEESRFLMGADV